MTTTREGVGRLRTSEGKACTANYTLKSWLADGGQTRSEGSLRCTDPDVAFESFRPGAVAILELGSGETLEIDITSILAEEITFVVQGGHKVELRGQRLA